MHSLRRRRSTRKSCVHVTTRAVHLHCINVCVILALGSRTNQARLDTWPLEHIGIDQVIDTRTMLEHCAPPTPPRMRLRRHHHRRQCHRMRIVLLGALALLVFAGTAAAAATPATGGGLVVVASTDNDATTAPASVATPVSSAGDTSRAPQKRIPEFVATDEWKEILPGQGIPRVRVCLSICCRVTQA